MQQETQTEITSPFAADQNLIALLKLWTPGSVRLEWLTNSASAKDAPRFPTLKAITLFGWKASPASLDALEAQIKTEAEPMNEEGRVRLLRALLRKTKLKGGNDPENVLGAFEDLIAPLSGVPASVALDALTQWTELDNARGEWFPSDRELKAELAQRMQLRDQLSAFVARSRAIPTKTSDGRAITPTGDVAAFIHDCEVKKGEGWVRSWLRNGATYGEGEIFCSAFAVDRIKLEARDLVDRHKITLTART